MQNIIGKVFYIASIIAVMAVLLAIVTMNNSYKTFAPFSVKSSAKKAEEHPPVPVADFSDDERVGSAPSAIEGLMGSGSGEGMSLGSMFGSGAGSAAAPEVWGPPAAGEATHADSTPSVDDILRKMELGNVAFNAPDTLNLNDSAEIELLLSLTEKIEELKKDLVGAGERMGETIRVTNRMEAKLSGHNFDITPIGPEIQAVSKEERTQWRWEIHPKKEGTQTLHLTLTAYLDVDGHDTARMIKTMDREIVVSVSNSKKFSEWLQNIVKVIVTIGSVAGAILGIIKVVNYLKTGKESK